MWEFQQILLDRSARADLAVWCVVAEIAPGEERLRGASNDALRQDQAVHPPSMVRLAPVI